MSDKQREAFEAKFPVPFGLKRIGSSYSMSVMVADEVEHQKAMNSLHRYNGLWRGWQAAQQEAEPLYVRVVSEPYGPGEQFVEVETASGKSVRVPSEIQGSERLIGPLYTAPQPVKAVPEGWNIEMTREGLRIDSPDDHHCIVKEHDYFPRHHPLIMLYELCAAMLATHPDDNKP